MQTIKDVVEFLKMNEPPISAIAAIIGISVAVYAGIRYGKTVLRKAWHWLTRYQPHVPRETIRILPQMRGHWWHMGSIDGHPAMQMVSRWYATNITRDPVHILSARLVRPRQARAEDFLVLVRHPKNNIFGRYTILPGATTEICVDFWITPPIRKKGQDLRATLVVVDQFGNDHKIKNVVFKGPKAEQPKKIEPIGESIHAISDSVEKEIVAVLKAEVDRYRACGRRVGGLGSVQTTYKGQTMHGIGTEWREADSPKNQSIIPDPEAAAIESDNATALLNLYQKLRDDAGGNSLERSKFTTALLKRLSRSTEYAPIGYLILLAFFRIGQLPDVLITAKRDLQNDGAFGFSEVLRLLDGLLRFEHPAFTAELLDEIEKFVAGVEEHTFSICERVAAIRAFRLATQKV